MRSARLVLCLIALLGHGVRAADDELGASLALDVPVTATASLVWLGGELAKGALAPASCRWCAPGPLEDSVARGVSWPSLSLAGTLSDVGVYGLVPVAVVGGLILATARDGRLGVGIGWDLLLIAEAVVLAQAVAQVTKLLVARERPFVHWLEPSQKPHTAQPSDNNLSFYSQHTDFAFALVLSGWTVARMRGLTWANLVLYVGLPLATGVGYLRMAAGKHYLSDVLVGAALGSAFGVLVPAIHRWGRFLAPRGGSASVALVPIGGGALATLTCTY